MATANDKKKLDKDLMYSLKDGATRSGYNLHYFRRQCKSGRFICTKSGPHIFFTPDQFLKLPDSKVSANLPSIFDGLED